MLLTLSLCQFILKIEPPHTLIFHFNICRIISKRPRMSESTKIMYLVVEFEREKNTCAMEVVPDNWRDIDGQRCILYPNHLTLDRVAKAAKRADPPTDSWKSYPIRKEWWKTSKYFLFLELSKWPTFTSEFGLVNFLKSRCDCTMCMRMCSQNRELSCALKNVKGRTSVYHLIVIVFIQNKSFVYYLRY